MLMNTATEKSMNGAFSNKNLQKASFKNENLANASFAGSDLRGADFSGADLRNADLTNIRTGIPTVSAVFLFIAALVVSLLSGYIAMLAGHTVQGMLRSTDEKIRIAGLATIVLLVLFVVFYYLKGGKTAIQNLLLPVVILSALAGALFNFTGAGTGMGMAYLILAFILVAVMFFVGTVARTAAGTLSSTILFVVVALGGGMFGKSLGGGIGTVVMAISCALISKKALSGAKGFEGLRKIAFAITSRYGTSFRSSRLANANFSGSKIRNSDFSQADLSLVKWGDSKKTNCFMNQMVINDTKKSH